MHPLDTIEACVRACCGGMARPGRPVLRDSRAESGRCWGFTHFPIVAVVAVVGELNAAPIAVVEKRGFVFDGRARADQASEPGVMNRYLLTPSANRSDSRHR